MIWHWFCPDKKILPILFFMIVYKESKIIPLWSLSTDLHLCVCLLFLFVIPFFSFSPSVFFSFCIMSVFFFLYVRFFLFVCLSFLLYVCLFLHSVCLLSFCLFVFFLFCFWLFIFCLFYFVILSSAFLCLLFVNFFSDKKITRNRKTVIKKSRSA